MGDSGDWDFSDLVSPLDSLQIGATLLFFDCLQTGAEGNVKRHSAEIEKAYAKSSRRMFRRQGIGRASSTTMPAEARQSQ